MNPYEHGLTLFLIFHYGQNSYSYEYPISRASVPGQTNLTSIPIPIAEILATLTGVYLPINFLNLNFDLTSYFEAELSKIGFASVFSTLKWTEKGTKSLFFDFNGHESGIGNVKIAHSNVVQEISGKFVISIPLIGTYTLYTFPIQTLYFSSDQEIDVITFYNISVISLYGATSGSGWFYKGTTATFKLEPLIVMSGEDTRNVFLEWKGEGPTAYSGSSNIASVVMNGPISETAVWKMQFKLTIVVEGHGTTSRAPQAYWENVNATIDLTATPEDGYQLEQWVVDELVSKNGTIQILMNSPHTVKAVFTQIPLLLTPLYGIPLYAYLVVVIVVLGVTLTFFFVRRRHYANISSVKNVTEESTM